VVVSHFHCRDCGASAEFGTLSAAKGEGWTALENEGRAGPVSGVEYAGLCPDCSSAA
jgi:Fe2+ or Zn2+ uptake regulation protein